MILDAEKKVLDFMEKHIHIFFAAAVLLIGCYMRIVGFHFLSDDARLYLLKWYDEIKETGISEQVGNYNIPYQIIIYILTKLPLNPLHAYKVVSCAFDLGLACLSGFFVWTVSGKKASSILAFALVFCSPIVLMNSAVWAQCDSIYAFFGIAALFLLFREKYALSFVLLGLSFAFKLQAVFLFPFFLLYYACRRKFSIFYFWIVPAVMVLVSLPGLLAGRNPMDIVTIYLKQTNVWDIVYINYSNVYGLVAEYDTPEYKMFRGFALMVILLLMGIGLYLCLQKKTSFKNALIYWGLVIWSLYTCNYFLTNMHERYAYILEVVAILYCFITPKGIPMAILLNLLSVFTYSSYLFGYRAVPVSVGSLLSLVCYAVFTFWLFFRVIPFDTEAC